VRFGFVIPRFGEEIGGGAETLVGTLARRLKERGDDVVAITTCAKDHRTWENEYPEGESIAYGIRTIRFPVNERDIKTWIPLQIKLSEGIPLTLDEELKWMSESVNSSKLYLWLKENQKDFDLIFFAPYLFGTTFFGSLSVADKAVLIPCLHDEAYAYTKVVGSMIRQAKGCLFNTDAERRLAERLYGGVRGGVVGMGFDPLKDQNFPRYFSDDKPYILYLGRKETGKNCHTLIDFYIESNIDVRLVIAGGGSFDDILRPNAKDRVVDLSHVSESEKMSLLKHALFLAQPSRNESFSIVLMEAWQVGTPVAVHALCDVTREHVVKSGGGLYFESASDFKAITEYFLEPGNRERLGDAGKEYVRKEYSWEAVLERFDAIVQGMLFDEARRADQ
jgi:glycosyltransferase involved in cell wall biosynthesis